MKQSAFPGPAAERIDSAARIAAVYRIRYDSALITGLSGSHSLEDF